MLTIAVSLISFLPTIYADDIDVDTYLFLSVVPDPVGVNQPVTVVMMCSRLPGADENRWAIKWKGWELTATKPDGTTVTLGTYESDMVGSQWTQYVPDQVGKWYFQFSFPGQTGEGSYTGKYFKPVTSPKVELTVQQEPIQQWPETPLPSDYWSRPINAENRDWWRIAGNWLARGYDSSAFSGFNPYTTAPNTAHIVWTKEVTLGGIAGGQLGSVSYDPKWMLPTTPPVIINGRIYFRINNGLACVDIRTGEELWWQDGVSIDWGQVYNFESPQQHGILAYLWKTGSTYKMYDAFTGDWILDMANATSVGGMFAPAKLIMSPKGEMLVYFMGGSSPNTWLAMWNSSAVTGMMSAAYGLADAQVWSWSPHQGATLDWRTGVQWNVTLGVEGRLSITKIDAKNPDVIYSRRTITLPDTTVIATDMAFSIKQGEEGLVLWGPVNRTAQPSRSTLWMMDGVFVEYVKETMQCHGYDIYSGRELWVSDPYTNAFGVYEQESRNAGYGNLYHGTYEGIVHCINLTTGERLWDYYIGSSGFETPYGHWPFYGGSTVADGKLYVPTGEHTPGQPIWKGERLYCIDTETGKGVWNITGLFLGPAIADGYAVTVNAEDNRMYCFGKGLTETTVSGPESVQPLGTPVLIKGTVMDQSPGAKDTPAISDEDMSEWMEYLYMQQLMPTDATGVQLTIDAIDPNGNFIHIDTATSDISGLYSYQWTPEHEGKYTIIATFEGSGSYCSSYAETAIGVGPASAPTQPIEPEEPAEAPFITTEIAIIAAVVVVAIIGIVAFWALRKRK